MDARMQPPPYYAKIKLFPPESWGPPPTSSHARKCLLIMGKKYIILPLTAGTGQLYLRTQGSASLSSLTAGTHPVEAYVVLSVLSRTCMYILADRSLRNDEPW